MTLRLRIEGSGASRVFELQDTGSPLIVGRGKDAHVRLEDPGQNTVSREHVSLRSDGVQVTLTVVSKHFGVDTSRGPLQPGQSSALQAGDRVTLARYTLHLDAVAARDGASAGQAAPHDPVRRWLGASLASGPLSGGHDAEPAPADPRRLVTAANGALHVGVSEKYQVGLAAPRLPTSFSGMTGQQNEISSPVLAGTSGMSTNNGAHAIGEFLEIGSMAQDPLPRLPPLTVEVPSSSGTVALPRVEPAQERDTGWGDVDGIAQRIHAPATGEAVVDAVPVVNAAPVDAARMRGQPPVAQCGGEAAIKAFFRGTGITPPEAMREEDWGRIGATLRRMAEALSQMMADRAKLKDSLRADRTRFRQSDNNPYKATGSVDDMLGHLLFDTTGTGAFMGAERAVEEAIEDLRVHHLAIIAAARASVEGIVLEFSPEKLEETLRKGKTTRLPSFATRGSLWKRYVEYYEGRSAHMADWLELLFERYFEPTYAKEANRPGRPRAAPP